MPLIRRKADGLQTRYTGGTVFHGLIGEALEDPEACKNLVRAVASTYRIPYFTISPTFSVCPVHGYLAGEQFECPRCKEEESNRLRSEIIALESLRSRIA